MGIAYQQLVPIMVGGVLISTFIMLVAAGPLTRFMERYPTTMLAFAFMLLIGGILLVKGSTMRLPALIYGIKGFSIFVEMLNILSRRRKAEPVRFTNPPREGLTDPDLPAPTQKRRTRPVRSTSRTCCPCWRLARA